MILADTPQESPPSKRLVFGIAPFMSPMSLVKLMAPLKEYLSEEMGSEILIETATDAKDFSRRTLDGRYDFVLTNPTFSLMAIDKGGFQVVATQREKLSGYFIVLDNTSIETIEELAGRHVGAPPKVGFMGQLIEPYLNNISFPDNKMPQITHFNSHNAAIYALRLGDIDATLIVSFMEKHLRDKGLSFKIIHRTEAYPGMTVIAKQDMDPEQFKTLQTILLTMDQNDKGKAVLSSTEMSGYEMLQPGELEKVRPYIPNESEQ